MRYFGEGDESSSPEARARRLRDARRAEERRLGRSCEEKCERPYSSIKSNLESRIRQMEQSISTAKRELRGARRNYQGCLTQCPTQTVKRGTRMPRRKVLQPIGFRSRSSRRRGEDVSVIGGLGDLESMWARALQMAEEVYQETFVPEEITNLNDALQQTRQTELSLDAARTSLLRLHGAGGATPADFAAYNAIQSNLAQTQTSLLVASRRVFRRRPDVLRRLPIKVRKAPRLSMATVGISGFGYFGVDPVTGTAAGGGAAVAGMAPWMVCAIILAAIVAVGLIAWVIGTAIGLTAESMRDVIVTRAQTSAYESMVEGRSRVFDACMAGGGNSADCAGQAQDAVPTPEDAAAPLPDPAGAWVKWVAIGVMVVAGVYIYSDVQRRRNRSMLPVAGLSRSLLFSPQR